MTFSWHKHYDRPRAIAGLMSDADATKTGIQEESSGLLVNYYLAEVEFPQRENQPPYTAECEDIIEALNMTFDEANIFKEVWRQAAARKGRAKAGNTAKRGAEKILHYAKRIYNKVLRNSTGE